MKKIIPFLWFEKDLDGIIKYYSSIFPNVTVSKQSEIDGTPSGSVQINSMYIYGTQFDLMTAGPYLPFNPTISFIINCDTTEEVEELWSNIVKEGKELMPLSEYPFAKKYGWAQDKYGVSWQVLCMEGEKPEQKITSTLMFCGDMCGRAEEAMNMYADIFENSHIDYNSSYEESDSVDDTRAKTKHAGFTLSGSRFAVLDSGKISPLNFNQAISFVVYCEDQKEIDYFWEKLTQGGIEVQCGWLSDKFGVPWQIVPRRMITMLSSGTKDQITKVTEAFMKMKKFDIETLEKAFAI